MEEIIETLQRKIIESCLIGIEDATLTLTKQLPEIGINTEAISVEYWPRYNKEQIGLKIWDGDNHFFKHDSTGIILTTGDVLAIVKRRQILKRKYNGL